MLRKALVYGVPAAAAGAVATAAFFAEEDSLQNLSNFDGFLRFSRTSYNCAVVAADYKYTGWRWSEKDPELYKEKLRETHTRAANRMLKVCKANGGVYTKWGQYLSSMNHVLPKEYTDTMAVLQDKAKFQEFETVKSVIEAEFGKPLEEVFLDFERTPIASASLAQVHKAKLKDGTPVAVKVQYKGLRKQVEGDLWTTKVLLTALGKLFPDLEYTWMLPEFEENIRTELQFNQEGLNSERLGRMFANDSKVRTPKIYWEVSSPKVLTMEFIDGIKVNNTAALAARGISSLAVAKKVVEVFGMMTFYHGFVHCDPHAGNLLVTGEGNKFQVVVLDHGMYRRLSPWFRRTYCLLWKALLTMDSKLMAEVATELGIPEEYHEFLPLMFTFRSSSSKGKLGSTMTKEEREHVRSKFQNITRLDVNLFMQSLPRDMLFTMRSNALIRGLNKELGGTTRSRFNTLAECAIRGVSLNDEATKAAAKTSRGEDEAAIIMTPELAELAEANLNETKTKQQQHATPAAAAPIGSGDSHNMNLPVASELQQQYKRTGENLFRVKFEIYKLRVSLWLLDLIASFVWWWHGLAEPSDKDIG